LFPNSFFAARRAPAEASTQVISLKMARNLRVKFPVWLPSSSRLPSTMNGRNDLSM